MYPFISWNNMENKMFTVIGIVAVVGYPLYRINKVGLSGATAEAKELGEKAKIKFNEFRNQLDK